MSTIASKIDHMIAECESRIAEVIRQLRVLQAELDGYRAAKNSLDQMGIGRRKLDEEGPTRALSESWRSVLLQIGEAKNTGMSIDDIFDYQNLLGLGISRNTIRSQLSIYTSKGFLDRIAASRYQLTELGSMVASQEPKFESSNKSIKTDSRRFYTVQYPANSAEQPAQRSFDPPPKEAKPDLLSDFHPSFAKTPNWDDGE
jgi:hypothetical protein